METKYLPIKTILSMLIDELRLLLKSIPTQDHGVIHEYSPRIKNALEDIVNNENENFPLAILLDHTVIWYSENKK
jgi:hypothetical protein